YGVTANLRGHYTLSTLVPLEVGGTTSTANLWPRLHGQGADDSSWLTIVHQHLCRHDLALDTARSLFPDPATWQPTKHGNRLPATTSPAPTSTPTTGQTTTTTTTRSPATSPTRSGTTATAPPATATTITGTSTVPPNTTTTRVPTTTPLSPTTTTVPPVV